MHEIHKKRNSSDCRLGKEKFESNNIEILSFVARKLSYLQLVGISASASVILGIWPLPAPCAETGCFPQAVPTLGRIGDPCRDAQSIRKWPQCRRCHGWKAKRFIDIEYPQTHISTHFSIATPCTMPDEWDVFAIWALGWLQRLCYLRPHGPEYTMSCSSVRQKLIWKV